MKLITKEIEAAFKAQGDTSRKKHKDIKIICKLFNPMGAGTWCLYEDLGDGIYMCFANLNDPLYAECGTVSLDELKHLQLPLGMSIERDQYFGEHTLADVISKVKAGEHV